LLVVAARLIADLPPGLRDSKLMSRKQREEMVGLLNRTCEFGEGWVTANEIDELGLANALKTGIARASSVLRVKPHEEIILDGKVNYIDPKFTNARCVIDGDALVPLVSAASIYAKVRRDEYMSKLKEIHPAYGFEKHVGYGTLAHRLAIVENGVLDGIHRLSFKPVKLLAEAGV
jgi:ribonuclease HII